MMSLSPKTVNKIADALKPEVIEHIYMSEKYAECMQQLIMDAIDDKMGEMDEDLMFDLGMLLFDRIEFK
jgi:hypothetical protein